MNRRGGGPLSPTKGSQQTAHQQSSLLSFYSPVKRNASEITPAEEAVESSYFAEGSSSSSSSSSSLPYSSPPTSASPPSNVVVCKPTDVKRRKIGGSLQSRGNPIISPLPSSTPKRLSPPTTLTNPTTIPVVKRASQTSCSPAVTTSLTPSSRSPSISPTSSPSSSSSSSVFGDVSHLTPEQIERMERNRAIALERQRATAAMKKLSPPSTPTSQSTPSFSSPSSSPSPSSPSPSPSSQSRSAALASQFSSSPQAKLQTLPTANSISSTTLTVRSPPKVLTHIPKLVTSPLKAPPASKAVPVSSSSAPTSAPKPTAPTSSLSRFAAKPSSPSSSSSSSSATSTTSSPATVRKPLTIPSSPISSSSKAATSRETDEKRWKWLVDIRDDQGRRPDAPDYNPSTLYIPATEFNALTDTRRQYWGYKRKHFDHVVFIQIGGFYELYETDADLGEHLFNLHVTQRVNMRSCGVPLDAVEPWSSKLVAHGYKVAIMEQAGAGSGGGAQARRIRVVMTPGTLVDSILLTDPSSTYLLSIKENLDPLNPSYGICLVDCAIAEFNLGEFQDDSYRSSFETLLVQTRPKEIVFERGASGLSERTRKLIKDLIPNAIQNGRSPQEFWDSESTVTYLSTRFGDSSEEWPELLYDLVNKYSNSKERATGRRRGIGGVGGGSETGSQEFDGSLALSALGACLHYLDELQLQDLIRQRNFKDYKVLQRQNDQASMILDGQTILNLEILGTETGYPNGSSSSSSSSSSSLLSLMDHTVTPFGKRLFKRWLCHPLRQIPQINARLDAADEIIADDTLAKRIKADLGQLPDLERLLSRINAGSIRLADFLKVLDGFEHVWVFITETMSQFKLKSKLLKGLCTLTVEGGLFPDIYLMLSYFEGAIDKEASRRENKIVPKSGSDEEYDTAENDLQDVTERIEARMKEFRKMLGRLSETELKMVENSKKGHMIEIKRSCLSDGVKKLLPQSWKLVDETKTVLRYQDPQLRTLLKQLDEAKENYNLALSGLYVRTLQKFQQFFEVCHSAVERIAHMDCLLSLAITSKFTTAGMCRPIFVDSSSSSSASSSSSRAFLDFKELRHPFISPSVVRDFIPNDVRLGGRCDRNEKDNEKEGGGEEEEEEAPYIMLLTGPNMGGKSTLLRQTCIAVIMAQVGCRVPATKALLSPFDRIFTRIGANDDIMAGRSTFFVELQETSNILRNATSHSLVILDELGRGTSTFDGYSIAYATLDYLAGGGREGEEEARTSQRRDFVSSTSRPTPCVMFSTHYHMLVDDYEKDNRVGKYHMGFFLDDETKKLIFKYELEKGSCKSSHGMNVAKLAGMPEEIVEIAIRHAARFEANTTQRRTRNLLAKEFSKVFKSVIAAQRRDPKALERLRNLQ